MKAVRWLRWGVVAVMWLGSACSDDSPPNAAGAAGSGGSAGGGSTTELRDFLGDPDYPDDFWEPATYEEANVDGERLEQALERIDFYEMAIHSLLVARNGRLVFERYGYKAGANPDDPDTPHWMVPDERHKLFSTTKSILSALIGIALDDGAIPGLDATAASFFPDYDDLNPSEEKSAITVEDLLTMRSGLSYVEGETDLSDEPDPARATLSFDMVEEPGTVWNYCTGCSDILAEILRVSVEKTPLEFANERLFAPIGIDSPPWDAAENGVERGGTGLWLTPREMARFGELYRNSGSWDGESVVPAEWTDESTTPRTTTTWSGQYAYHFWVPNVAGFFSTLGAYGQMIFVNRELGLVVVVTGDLDNETMSTRVQSLLVDFIVPASL
jgi:CubicO group peptidase (beta-lactamase class C family)